MFTEDNRKMNEFSKQLSFFVSDKGASIPRMASYCGVDRSTMYKLINGTRKPVSEKLVKEICGFLKLSPDESYILLESFWIMEAGLNNFQRRKNTLSFLRTCFKTPAVPSAPGPGANVFSPGEDHSAAVALRGRESIFNACTYIISQELNSENGCLNIHLQPGDQFTRLFNILCSGEKCKDSFQIQHVIALDKSHDSGKSVENNLNLICSIIPFLKQLPNYHLYYHYSGNSEETPDFSLFPCLILTGKYAVQFSEDLQFGILFCHGESVALIKDVFLNLLNACLPMTRETADYRNMLIEGENRYSGQSAILIHPFPCLNFLLTKELMSKYVKNDLPERNFIINSVLGFQEGNRKFYDSHLVKVIASEKGIRNYLKNGMSHKYLSNILVPFDEKDRILVISRFRDLVKKYGITYRLVRESFGELSSSCIIWVKDCCVSFLFVNCHGTFSNLFLREPEIIACFTDFFSYMSDYLYYSEKESIEILDRILDEV